MITCLKFRIINSTQYPLYTQSFIQIGLLVFLPYRLDTHAPKNSSQNSNQERVEFEIEVDESWVDLLNLFIFKFHGREFQNVPSLLDEIAESDQEQEEEASSGDIQLNARQRRQMKKSKEMKKKKLKEKDKFIDWPVLRVVFILLIFRW